MQTTRHAVFAVIAALLAFPLAMYALRPEIPAMPVEMLQKKATHIAIGEVERIYSTKERDGKWRVTRYVAEIRVEKTEKGEALPTDEPVFVRWFSRSWSGGTPVADSNGHYGWTPKAGDDIRVYLAKNAHDGFHHDDFDGGLNVLVPNGFEKR